MSTLVFSDTHFGKKFDRKRFNKLAGLINKADKVIINGDLWEGFNINFDEFLTSDWKKLFPLLKKKKTVYVYGNHDDPNLSDKRVLNFCKEAVNEYALKTPKRTFFFTHGQEFLFPKKAGEREQWKSANSSFYKLITVTSGWIQLALFKVFGANVFPKAFNKISKEKRASITNPDYLLVCGHSHTPQYNKKMNFLDLGFFNYGWANYMIIDKNGNFDFVSERY